MKRWIAVAALCVLAVVSYLAFHPSPRSPSRPVPSLVNPASIATTNAEPGSPGSRSSAQAGSAVTPPPSPAPSPQAAAFSSEETPGHPEFTNIPPAAVIDNMRHVFHQYDSMFGGNPVGTNPEITAALAGENPKHANFIDPSAGMRVNAQGALVDPWGTPYFFHQLSGHEMEIHSAGPDRKMWTADDLVVK